MLVIRSRALHARSLLAALALALPASDAVAQDAIWGVRLGGTQAGSGYAVNGADVVAVPDGSGDFYACGTMQTSSQYVFGGGTPYEIVKPRGTGARQEPYLARYRADGTPVWVRMGRGTAIDVAERLAVYPDGSVLMTGTFNFFVSGLTRTGIVFEGGAEADVFISTNQSGMPFVARYSPTGDLQFARAIVRGGDSATIEDPVALPDGGFVLVGSFRGATFGDIADPHPISMPLGASFGSRSSDGFVARYGPNGDILWVHRVKGAAADNVSAAELLEDGDLVLTCEIGRRDILPVTFFENHPAALTLPIEPERQNYVLRLDFAQDTTSLTPAFTVQWIHALGRGGSLTGQHVIRRGSNGELYIAGHIAGDLANPAGGYFPTTYDSTVMLQGVSASRCYIARIAPADGSLLWAIGPNSGADSSRVDLAPTDDGLAFVMARNSWGNIGQIVDTSGALLGTFDTACHGKLDRDGNLLWARSDRVSPSGATVVNRSFLITTGDPTGGLSYLDYGAPTQINLVSPYYRAYLAQYEVAPATSLVVPGDIARSCDPGVHGATVHFVIEVEGAPTGSRLLVRDTTHATILADLLDPSGSVGVGPVLFPMGVSAISVQLVDAASTVLLEDGFLVTVEDTTPPVIDGCGPQTLECTGPETQLLHSLLGLRATDGCDPTPELSLSPAAVPHGTTTVVATARDDSGNASSCSFTVTVQDTLPPLFTVIPTDIERECSMPHGAIVAFDVLAEDVCGIASLVCIDQTNRPIDPAGTFFEHGLHTVTCTATDPSQNSASVSFQVRIVDNTAPVLVAPNDLSLPNDAGECTAVAHFQVAATDLCDPAVAITCTAPWGPVQSGDAFPIGTTPITCVALDRAQNRAEASFSITVYDAEPPHFGGNAGGTASLVTDCEGRPIGADAASLGVTIEDNCDAQPLAECSPATLLPGITPVTITARDADGNAATTTVLVTVLRGAFHCEVLRPLDPHVDNRIHAGRVVPIKLRVACEGHEVTDATVTIDTIERLATDGTPIANELVEDPGASQDGGNLFRVATSQYHYNLSTSGWVSTSGVRHRVTVRIQKAGHVDTLCEIYLVNR
ncbi:MAG: HYR domain-containing protein [Planctomycetes bacterium]|nr:HYR domain-containing protein [Planctomycetota bacterium]